jgi:uncharacterized protein with PQ loop repeat
MKYDWIGWLATAVFMTSYISKSPIMLRRIQALASCLWLTYGVMIHSVPMIVANALVAVVALYSSISSAKSSRPV